MKYLNISPIIVLLIVSFLAEAKQYRKGYQCLYDSVNTCYCTDKLALNKHVKHDKTITKLYKDTLSKCTNAAKQIPFPYFKYLLFGDKESDIGASNSLTITTTAFLKNKINPPYSSTALNDYLSKDTTLSRGSISKIEKSFNECKNNYQLLKSAISEYNENANKYDNNLNNDHLYIDIVISTLNAEGSQFTKYKKLKMTEYDYSCKTVPLMDNEISTREEDLNISSMSYDYDDYIPNFYDSKDKDSTDFTSSLGRNSLNSQDGTENNESDFSTLNLNNVDRPIDYRNIKRDSDIEGTSNSLQSDNSSRRERKAKPETRKRLKVNKLKKNRVNNRGNSPNKYETASSKMNLRPKRSVSAKIKRHTLK